MHSYRIFKIIDYPNTLTCQSTPTYHSLRDLILHPSDTYKKGILLIKNYKYYHKLPIKTHTFREIPSKICTYQNYAPLTKIFQQMVVKLCTSIKMFHKDIEKMCTLGCNAKTSLNIEILL